MQEINLFVICITRSSSQRVIYVSALGNCMNIVRFLKLEPTDWSVKETLGSTWKEMMKLTWVLKYNCHNDENINGLEEFKAIKTDLVDVQSSFSDY